MEITLYNSFGERVSVLTDSDLSCGIYTYTLDLHAKGIYFITTVINGIASSQKILKIE